MAKLSSFNFQTTLPYSSQAVFAWHTQPGAFERLNPPWRPVRITSSSGSIQVGAKVSIQLPLFGPISIPWDLSHTSYTPNQEFRDEQIRGPFKKWRHDHQFIAHDSASMTMLDTVQFQLPIYLKPLAPIMMQELTRLFRFRHSILAHDLALHERWRDQPRKTIVIAGASGFVGSALSAFLSTAGHTVIRLVRRAPRDKYERSWNPASGQLDPDIFDGVDVVINLCGENIAERRWTKSRKEAIKESRVQTSSLLASTIASLASPPSVVIMASAIGYYGDTGEREVDEQAPPGSGFLADVGRAWESATIPLSKMNSNFTNSRLVTLRLGTVLNHRGGALAKMLPLFKLGLGGQLGAGSQFMSWIALEDLLGIFEHIIYTPEITGPVNAVAPKACTNREFTETLGSVLNRPTVIRAPQALLRIGLGEMATALLLSSNRVVPRKLMASGYDFIMPDLSTALKFELGLTDKDLW